MDNYIIRQAIEADAPFVAEAIISAEKSHSDKLSLASLFDLTESKARSLIIEMLEEEIDGCEFSLSSFLLVEFEKQPIAAVGGWIEQFGGELPSKLLKSNLIGFVYPRESLEAVGAKGELISGLQIERAAESLQIEYVYVNKQHRGKRLAQRLIEAHILRATKIKPDLSKLQVQLFSNNNAAIKLYERSGFSIAQTFSTNNQEVLNYMAYNEKILMEKQLNNQVMEGNNTIDKIQKILVSVLKHDDFELTNEITANEIRGWDSLSHMMIISEIEKTFSIRFKLRELNKLKDMGSLIDMIHTKTGK